MTDDYFSDEAIKARVNKRMKRFRYMFTHVALMFLVIFGVILLAAVGVITEPVIAVAVVILTIFSMIVHGMAFGLAMMRESFLEEEIKAATAAAEKRKNEDMTLSDDGELVPLESRLSDEDDAYSGDRSARQHAAGDHS